MTIRPVFIPSVAVLSVLPLQIFFTIWGAGFFGGFSLFAVEWLGLNLPEGSTFIFWGLAFFFGIPFLVYFGQKRTYEKTVYKFYRDKLVYMEGFLASEEKTIKYDKITESSLREGIFQKKYNLGTVRLATPATSVGSGRSSSGIRIQDIEHPEKVYKKVKELIGC